MDKRKRLARSLWQHSPTAEPAAPPRAPPSYFASNIAAGLREAPRIQRRKLNRLLGSSTGVQGGRFADDDAVGPLCSSQRREHLARCNGTAYPGVPYSSHRGLIGWVFEHVHAGNMSAAVSHALRDI